MRCSEKGCKKKVTEFNDFTCNYCTKLYCAKHRLPINDENGHSCNTEAIKKKHEMRLKQENPVVVTEKFIRI